MTTPRLAGFSMPPEWAPHERTWMEFPPVNEGFGRPPTTAGSDHCREVWASVANTIARFEPVSLVCNVGDGEIARALVDPSRSRSTRRPSATRGAATAGPRSSPIPTAGSAPRTGRSTRGATRASATRPTSSTSARSSPASPGAELFSSPMVNEGGGIHVDGEGTVLSPHRAARPGPQPDLERRVGGDRTEGVPGCQQGHLAAAWADHGLRHVRHPRPRRHRRLLRAGRACCWRTRSTDPSHPDFEVSQRVPRASCATHRRAAAASWR